MSLERPDPPPSVVMVTADRQIDHRILLESDSLEAAGWQVTIVAMPQDESSDSDDARVVRIHTGQAVAARENFVLCSYRWLRRRLPMNGPLMRLLKTIAWRYAVDQEAFYCKLFSESLARFSPSVFVAHDLPMLPVARQAALRCGARLVYDSHELYCEQEFPARERQRWTEIEARHIGACDAVITINSSIAQELARRYGVRVHVIHNAKPSGQRSVRQWRFHEAFGLDRKRRLLLFQGGLSSNRHLDVLVEAMSHVKTLLIDLVILGDGQLKQSMQRSAQRLGVAQRVHFHPAVPQHVLPEYTASADAGVIPYQPTCLNNYYCTPNKLFEFMAAGLPILGSDLPEIRNIVSGQQVGLVGDTSSPPKLAALIDEFFGDDHRFRGWQLHIAEVQKSFCWEREGAKIVSIYEAFR